MGKYFGTDGIRGVANEVLTPEMAFKLGRAGAYVLTKGCAAPKIIIGKDTRISGDMLEAALIAGITSAGVDVLQVGVLPTPGIAYLTRILKATAGVVISASHNPVEDNGIKFFADSGYKLPDEVEEEIEALLDNDLQGIPRPVGSGVGRVRPVEDATDQYIDFLKSTIKVDFSGLKVVVDCANGAAYHVAPWILRELGAEVIAIYDQPDGININAGCGSTHPEAVREKVLTWHADLGIAHDGDADRLIAVDSQGNIVDGDFIMVILALHLKAKKQLPHDTLVATVMSNLGLHIALRQAGIKVLETKVGDRYVLEEMLKTGAVLGGEQSGHIIFLEHNTTGDGVLTALQLISVIKESGKSLAELAAQMKRLPQVLVNVRVSDKDAVQNHPDLAAAIKKGEAVLGDQGRILVRPSGTESLIRVMAEGPDQAQLYQIVDDIVQVAKTISAQ
ncbi:MAG: phosphoglucosamine mutase [Clostridia bacterium]|nr:phosphoglucosamine mutase [Clostridia bacterium]